jgi:polyribonucleotide nucleotidyltransferase
MGMASDEKAGRYQVITDLQDLEDGNGGMDFKIAGTRNGITAIQLDTKTSGLPWNIVTETLERAKTARIQILDEMKKAIAAPRPEMSPFAPRIESFRINPDKIRDVIGPGGKMINGIIDALKVEIDIEDDGLVMVTSNNADSMRRAVEWIKELTREVAVGETFEGEVVRIMPFGAFVNILPKVDGLVHISELAQGRINLSMKRLDPDYVPSEKDNKPLRDGKGPRK